MSLTSILEDPVARSQRALVVPLAERLPRWVTANVLTGVRLVLAGVLGVLLWLGSPGLAAVVYLVALSTDALDGAVARLRRQASRLGARLDPTVDKVLHAVVFVAFFAEAPTLIGFLIALDVALFLLGMFLVLLLHREARAIAASAFGKWKLTFQAVAVLLLFWNALVPAAARVPAGLVTTVLVLALGLAVLSLAGYAQRLARGIRTS